MRRTRVAVIGGGQNGEHTVSLASASAAARALDPSAYDVLPLTIAPDGRWLGANGRPLAPAVAESLARAVALIAGCDVVLPLVHGPRGEDGTLAALLELAGVPYVGSGVRAGAVAMDKAATKLVAADLGIAVAGGTVVTHADLSFEGPVVVKPVAAGSSEGVALATDAVGLHSALRQALTVDDRALVEEVLVGDEVDVAVLRLADGRLVAGPTLRILTDGLFDATQKYDGTAVFEIPAAISDVHAKEIREAALALYAALGCDGVARFDFFVTDRGVVLNEVNTCPGLTEQSQVPQMFAAVGLPYDSLLRELVQGALEGTVRR